MLGNMADGTSPYLTGPRHSLLQCRAELVERFDRPPLTGLLLESI